MDLSKYGLMKPIYEAIASFKGAKRLKKLLRVKQKYV
jgi:hypothetical protein